MQTLAAEVAAKVSEDTIENRAAVENTIESLFLNASSFAKEDYYADIDAVNIASVLGTSYFVDVFYMYYIEGGVQKRYSSFLDYYGDTLNVKIAEILPDEVFVHAERLDLDGDITEIIHFIKTPFVAIRVNELQKGDYPTLKEIQVLKEYFLRYISEQSNKEW